ncbi:MAG TPA: flagellar motor protein MotA [Syntrophaceae bacterium]|nr:flagellar motor protein MotA [Syntrophaceae bacterium]HCX01458.1 flagellar motor protein MotA [Syntrophaceae bacterium]
MNILAGLETFLYMVSSVMLYPVVVALVLLIFWVVIFFGGFLREWIDRRRSHFSPLPHYLAALNEAFRAASDPRHLDITAERLLQEEELKLIKSLDRIRFVIRVGPALGLMGTLIPMGISLSSLAQGDMPKMAGSMVTAFTTVVVGLACSVAAYLMALVKEKWVRADMREMECETELLLRETTDRLLPETKEMVDDAVS